MGAVFLLVLLLTGWVQGSEPTPAAALPPSLEDRWGIKITSLRLSAAGQVLDFRYRVLDPDKAARVADRKLKPHLIHETSGAKLPVPDAPKIGSLRQAPQKLVRDRIYFILFSNPGQLVKAGDKVTVVIGDFRAEHLTVE